MTLLWLDPGGSATGGIEFLTSVTGTVTAQTSVHEDQPYAYKFDTSAGAILAQGKTPASAAAGGRVSKRTQFSSLPTGDVNVCPVGLVPSGSATYLLAVYIGSDGKLRLYTNGTTTICGAAGSTVLSAGTWYRISLCYNITTTTNWSAKVYINGTLEMTRTNTDATLSSATPANDMTTVRAAAGANKVLYTSDIYADNITTQADTGNVRVTRKAVTTVSSGSWDSTIGTGNLNERPLNTANRIEELATGPATIHYNVEAASAGDVDISNAHILGRSVWAWFTLSSLTGTPTGKLQLDGSPVGNVMDPSTAGTYQVSIFVDSTATYPSTIGVSSSGIAADTLVAELGVVVAYIPAQLQSLTGSQPAESGTVSIVITKVRAPTGNQPAESGALTNKLQALRSPTGDQPAESGVSTPKLQALRSLAGAQPAESGTIEQHLILSRSPTGNQPAESATLASKLQGVRSLTGNQPAESGVDTPKLQAVRALAGNQPAESGVESHAFRLFQSVAGDQPEEAGDIASKLQALRNVGTLPYDKAVLATPGLLAYWRLSEASGIVAEDDVGNHDAEINGTPTFGAAGLIYNNPDTSFEFVGDDSVYVFRVDSDHSLSPQGGSTGAISVEAWVKPDAGLSYFSTMVGHPSEWFLDTGPDDWAEFNVNQSTIGSRSATGSMTLGQVHHVVGTYDAADGHAVRLFVDGVEQTPNTLDVNARSNTGNDVQIARDTLAGHAYIGLVGKVAIYSLALSPATILEHFQIGSSGEGQPAESGDVSYSTPIHVSVAGNQPAETGTVVRVLQGLRSLAGDQPSETGTLTAIRHFVRSLTGNQPAESGVVSRILQATRNLTGNQPSESGVVTRLANFLRSLAGDQPAESGVVAALKVIVRTMSGNQPSETGTVARLLQAFRSVDGNQPSETGVVARLLNTARSIAGNQPAESGTLTQIVTFVRSLTGTQPSESGIVAASLIFFRNLTGDQPSETGSITRAITVNRAVAGNQPSEAGTVSQHQELLRSASGNQPSESGTISRLASFLRSASGDQPSESGIAQRILNTFRNVAGDQPSATGDAIGSRQLTRVLTGIQEAASGIISFIIGLAPTDRYHLRLEEFPATMLETEKAATMYSVEAATTMQLEEEVF